MILEILIIAAIIGMFIILARRLPDALKGEQGSLPPQNTPARPDFFTRARIWWKTAKREQLRPAKSPVAVAQSVKAPSEVLTEDVLLREGDTYMQEGKLKEAERAFLRAVAKNPKNPKLYNRLGAIYLKQRNYSDALQAFEAARDLDSSKASRHYNVALAAWQMTNLSKARHSIAQAISLDPVSAKYQELKQQIEAK
ncbi:tetratricopeptide repeat protein [Candidatus Berkelbacteria bacterium]|nr:tetratricopeptide repeat protein [Candidatus Berkelbacteria bacterium]